jgi:hypothetical protein
MTDEFDSYTLPRTTPIQCFKVLTSKKYVKKVVYAEKKDAVVGGSDHGKVYVFGIQNPKAQQTLIHKKKDIMIQTIEVRKLTHLNTL